MDVSILLVVIAVVCAVSFSNGQPLLEEQAEANQKFIPGVFISSVALKNLQDRAQQNDLLNQLGRGNQANLESRLTSNPSQDSTVKVNPPTTDNPRIESIKPVLVNQPAEPIQQPILANQQPMLTTQQAILVNQPPALFSTQPVTTNRQVEQPMILQQSSTPNQQPSLSSQPMLVNQESLPNQQAIFVTQPGLNNQQTQLIAQQPSQTILINHQPSLAQQSAVISQQPSLDGQQLVLQNGQIAPIVYQHPAVVQKPMQNPTTLYAIVSNVPNQIVSNINSYLVPVQQLQQIPNTVAINGK